jgi:hypothetical protein
MNSKFFVSKNFNDKHKVISFLYVVRDDIDNLIKSLESVFELSFFPENIEAIIWFDEDDDTYKQFVNSLLMNKYSIKVCVKDRVGYNNSAYMYDYMGSISTGDFLSPFGSDVFIKNKNWDLELYKYNKTDILIFRALLYDESDGKISYDSVGPGMLILTRRVYEILGGFITSQILIDRYLFVLACYCGILEHIYISILTYDYFLQLEGSDHNRIKDRQEMWDKTNSKETIEDIGGDFCAIKDYMDRNNIERRGVPYFHVRYYDSFFNNTNKNFAIEIFGGIMGENYTVDFIDKKNNAVVFKTNISNGTWANVFIQYYVDWKINVYHKDILIYTYDFDLKSRKVLVKIDSYSVDDISVWLSYVEEFRKKHGCYIYCSVIEKEKFQKEYPFIEFIDVGEGVSCGIISSEEFYQGKNNSGLLNGNDIFIEYTIGKVGDPNDKNVYFEDYNKIPIGKIASNMLGLEYKE